MAGPSTTDAASKLRLFDYTGLMTAVADELSAETEMNITRRGQMKRRLDAFMEISSSERAVVSGDVVMQTMNKALDSFSFTRTHTQRRFHRNFVRACLPHIYGPVDFERFRERILAENSCTEDYKQYVLIVTPRRWGKTTSVAMFVAAALWAIPEMWISVYSTGRRASNGLAELVAKFVCELDDGQGQQRILKRNNEELFLKGATTADVRRLYSYPSTVQVREATHGCTHTPPPIIRFYLFIFIYFYCSQVVLYIERIF